MIIYVNTGNCQRNLNLLIPEAPVMSMAFRFRALIMVMVSRPAVGR